MAKTALLPDELVGVILEAAGQNALTADVSDVEIAVVGHDVDAATRAKRRLACDWRLVRAKRGGRPFFDGAFDRPLETADHRVAAGDAEVLRALTALVDVLRERYAIMP